MIEKTRVQITKVKYDKVCDICNEYISKKGMYNCNEANIDCSIGDVYPDFDDRKRVKIDICTGCFMSKIKPAIEEQYGDIFREFEDLEEDGGYTI